MTSIITRTPGTCPLAGLRRERLLNDSRKERSVPTSSSDLASSQGARGLKPRGQVMNSKEKESSACRRRYASSALRAHRRSRLSAH
eukprot:457529-Pleurochrysis_carterae.AAC.2